MGEVRERRSTWSRTLAMGPYQMLLDAGENGVLAGPEEEPLQQGQQGQQGQQQRQQQGQHGQACVGVGMTMMRNEGALPCCGCGVGWCCFGMGFVLPLFWYYACFLFLVQCQNDPRERAGLAACAMAALVNTVALGMALVALFVQHQGFFQSSPSPPPPPF